MKANEFNLQQFDLPDGARTVVEWFGDVAASDQGVVIFLPALGVGVDYYRGLASAWAQRGYRVANIEMRGMKQSSVRDVKHHNFGYREVLNVDLATLIPALLQEASGHPIYLAGHSLGAQFALLYASRHPEKISGIIAIAGGSNYYASMPSWKTRVNRQLLLRLIRLVGQAFAFFPGDKLGFGGRQPLNLILDWTNEALTGRYRIIGDTTDYNAALGELKLPVMLLSLSGDSLVPLGCANFLAHKLKKATVKQVELQVGDVGMKALSHFGWAKKPGPVLDQVISWTRMPGPPARP
jgi:predicted alpha/beta hydrolase